MKRLAGLVLACLATLCVLHTPAATTRMPVEEVRPGMTGVGVTVFEGTRRDEFDVEILGVLRNVMGPRRDIIVARLAGGPLADTGVVAGMSGSPVYIDDRLIGAVSYALGSFAKEPIAGIPIGRNGGVRRQPRSGPAPGAHAAAISPARRRTARGGGRTRRRPGAAGAGLVRRPDARPGATAGGGRGRAATPDSDARGARRLHAAGAGRLDRSARIRWLRGRRPWAARPCARVSAEPLQAGDAVGAMLVRGDLDDGSHRHRDDGGGRPRIRLRPSVLQPRIGAVPDDARGRDHRAAESALSSRSRPSARPWAPSIRIAPPGFSARSDAVRG